MTRIETFMRPSRLPACLLFVSLAAVANTFKLCLVGHCPDSISDAVSRVTWREWRGIAV
jgi:hypothetical protein